MADELLETMRRALSPTPQVHGVTAESDIDEQEVWERALDRSRRRKQLEEDKERQRITFDYGPVCIVNIGDVHAGGTGVDYARLDRDLDLILATPGMFIGLAGDMLDNYIIGKLALLQIEREFKVSEEWVLVKRIVAKAAPKLLWSCSGNHDMWTYMLTGIDYFRDVHQQLAPNVLYGRHQILVNVHVGTAVFRWRIRHKWRGFSMYNDTHGIERANKFDQGVPFDIGVMAHTHTAGLSRQFNNGGQTGLAVICGAYKRHDEYADKLGLPRPNEQTAVAVILDELGGFITTSNLELAANFMRRMYPGDKSNE